MDVFLKKREFGIGQCLFSIENPKLVNHESGRLVKNTPTQWRRFQFQNHYSSSHNHGSVENSHISFISFGVIFH